MKNNISPWRIEVNKREARYSPLAEGAGLCVSGNIKARHTRLRGGTLLTFR